MNERFTLPLDLQHLLDQRVADGGYPSRRAALVVALNLLHEAEQDRASRLTTLKASVVGAIDALDAGGGRELDLDAIKRAARERVGV